MDDLLKIDVDAVTLAVNSRESARREFKESFDREKLTAYLKTMAAFANADGGVIMFGVSNRPRTLVGCTAALPDEAQLSDQVQRYFEPAIGFEIRTLEIEGKTVSAILVREAPVKPVICKKAATVQIPPKKPGGATTDQTILAEGDIYFRYAGKSERIRFAELSGIFQQRDQRVFKAIQESLGAIRKVGVDRIGIVDVHASGGDRGITQMYVPRDAVGSIRLIDKGRFVETADEGENAYFIAGTVEVKVAEPIPVDDQDRIRPKDAVDRLKADAATNLDPSWNLAEIHLSNFAKSMGWRTGEADGQHNTRYCKFDEKSSMWFYREAFVEELRRRMTDAPVETIQAMKAAKAVIDKVRARHAEAALAPTPELETSPA